MAEGSPPQPGGAQYPGVRLSSGPPWHLSCALEEVEGGFRCCIGGLQLPEGPVGAVVVSHWQWSRAVTTCVALRTQEDEDLALHAAHKLCKASQRNVTCSVGIHHDAITGAEVGQRLDAAMALVTEAAAGLEEWSAWRRLQRPGGIYSRIEAGIDGLLLEIESFLDRDLERLLDEQRTEDASTKLSRQVLLFAPLYLSNACPNDCAYCGFRRSARFERTRIGIEEAVENARHLAGQGHRTIDVVTPEIATDRFVEYVCEVIERILRATAIRRINVNVGALSREQYGQLRSAGATGFHLYQETYLPRPYFQVHRSGLKRDMAYRLEAPRRALEAGFRRLGLGVLLGVGPLCEDLARLVRHAELLESDFPDVQLGFSLPRVKRVDAECDYAIAAPVDDDPFIKAFIFLRQRFPRAHLTLTTRESPALRDRLVPLGVSKLGAGVSTSPGGYRPGDRDRTSQFDVSDERPVAAVVDGLQRAGLTPVFE